VLPGRYAMPGGRAADEAYLSVREEGVEQARKVPQSQITCEIAASCEFDVQI